jgi:hypothetical protein
MKAKKKDEQIDFTQLPKINIVTNTLLLNFVNNERRFKVLEQIYKNPHKLVRFIPRDHIVDFAKEQKIFIEPVIKPKDPNPPELRDINAEELAKAAALLIQDRSVPVMREKKTFMELIEERKKQKEEATAIWNNPPPVDPKKKNDGKKQKEPVNPDDIVVPILDEFQTDMIIVFYNYPLNESEYMELTKEKIALNHVMLLNETDPLIEVPIDDPNDKTKKPAVKDTKPSNEVLLMQKLFQIPNKPAADIYNELQNTKYYSDKMSLARCTYFEQWDFAFKFNEELKKDSFVLFQEDLLNRLNYVNKTYLNYLKWMSKIIFEKFTGETASVDENFISRAIIEGDIEKKDFEHISTGATLFSFCNEILKRYRVNEEMLETNKVIYEKNNIDDLFEQYERQIDSEYAVSTNIPISNRQSQVETERVKEEEQLFQQMTEADDMSSCFKLVIDHNDFVLKNSLENKLHGFSLSEREKILYYFRSFPGIARYQMPDLAPKEENFRKAKKCEVYPFLKDVNIQLYEKYEIIKQFENLLKESTGRSFDLGNRVYQEPMNTDIVMQALNHAILLDPEVIVHYNERDDNILFATYYKCPQGRVYRKTNRYRYLSKPDFENWVNYFRPTYPFDNELLIPPQVAAIPNPNEKKPAGKELQNVSAYNEFYKPKVITDQTSLNFGIPYDKENILYEADDTYVGEVREKFKYMFPTDNGIFIKKTIENGIFSSSSSYVVKDDAIFGIRTDKNGVPEFWMRFDDDVLLTINYIGDYNALAEQVDTQNGTYTTMSYRNGLNVQVLPNGDLCQKNYKLDEQFTDEEVYRITTSKASIIKQYANKTQLLYANGNVCNIMNGIAINTNNKGYRVARNLNEGVDYELDPIPTTIQTDAESNSIIFSNIQLKF